MDYMQPLQVLWDYLQLHQEPAKADCIVGFGNFNTDIARRAAELYRKAAWQENPTAACNLGYLYETGVGVEQSWEEAVEWYMVAVLQDHPRAMFRLGLCYEQGHGVAASREKALELYRSAAELGYPDAEEALARLTEGAASEAPKDS